MLDPDATRVPKLGTGTAITLGALGFLLCLGLLVVGMRAMGASMASLETRFPTPG